MVHSVFPLSHPSQLSPEIFSQVFQSLEALVSQSCTDPQVQLQLEVLGAKSVRLRDWWLGVEPPLGSTVQIFLDFSPFSPIGVPSVSIELCTSVHRFMVQQPAFEQLFSASLAVEVSSPGAEPVLRSLNEFEAAVGWPVEVDCWTEFSSRKKYVMLLSAIEKSGAEPALVLSEGAHTFTVSLREVKRARALVFHPLAPVGTSVKRSRRQNAHSHLAPHPKSK